MSDVITWSKESSVATVWLDRPDRRNAMGMAFWPLLPKIMKEIDEDPEVHAVVLAAKGRDFTVGIDLQEMASVFFATATDGVAGREKLLHEVGLLQASINSVNECRVPVIAAIHGWCIGGGIDLITACDIRLGTRDSKYSVRETKVAIVADLGTLQRLQRVVAPGIAAELVYTGKDIDAGEAERVGLLNRAYEDQDALFAAAQEMAAEIAANSPLTVRGAKKVMNYSADRPVSEGLAYVALWNTAFLHSEDLAEAMSAFIEKRAPQFRGR